MSAAAVNDLAIDLANVEKTYRGKVRALRGISMQVHAGEIFGLLGPNGAGKSTLVKILMTVIRASRCEGRMLGRAVGDKGTLARIGYLPEHHKFPDYLTARQVLHYFAALAGVERRTRKDRAAALLDVVGLGSWADKKVKGFSKGMRQRLGIANAMMNDPDLVLLDEPTDGVDPVGRRDIRTLVQQMKDQGKTVLLNSHLLSELEMVCDRVAILVQGVVSAQGTIDALTKDSRRYEIEVESDAADRTGEAARLTAGRLAADLSDVVRTDAPALPAAEHTGTAPAISLSQSGPVAIRALVRRTDTPIVIDGMTLKVGTEKAEVVQPLIDALRSRGYTIKAVRPVRESLEDLFMRAVTDPETGETLRPGARADARNGRRGE